MRYIWHICLMLLLFTFFPPAFADDINDIIIIKRNSNRQGGEQEHNSKQAGDVIMSAMGLLGVPYVFGGNSPSGGLDCSGFIKYVFQKSMNVNLPRTAAAMAQTGKSISKDSIKPGDLVFFNTRGFANSHVGLYIGSGKFLHAPRTGKTVEVANMNGKYWTARYNGARRIDSSMQKSSLREAKADTLRNKVSQLSEREKPPVRSKNSSTRPANQTKPSSAKKSSEAQKQKKTQTSAAASKKRDNKNNTKKPDNTKPKPSGAKQGKASTKSNAKTKQEDTKNNKQKNAGKQKNTPAKSKQTSGKAAVTKKTQSKKK